MKTYIRCTLKSDDSIIMNVEAFKNIEYLDKTLWDIEEITTDKEVHLHVCENALVFGNARVFGKDTVFGNVHVCGFHNGKCKKYNKRPDLFKKEEI